MTLWWLAPLSTAAVGALVAVAGALRIRRETAALRVATLHVQAANSACTGQMRHDG